MRRLKTTCKLFLLRSRLLMLVRGEKSSEDLATDLRPLAESARCWRSGHPPSVTRSRWDTELLLSWREVGREEGGGRGSCW